MDMRVNAEHLASVSNLGLRTVQRIETAGAASNESISAIASALEVPWAHEAWELDWVISWRQDREDARRSAADQDFWHVPNDEDAC